MGSRGRPRAGSEVGLELTLLERVARGDESAVQATLDRFGGLVWSLARRLCPTPADAEDAVQEIFVEIWRTAGRYDPRISSEATFIAMVARRRLIDRRRKHARTGGAQALQADEGDDRPIAEAGLQARDEAATAVRALSELTEAQQKVISMSVFRGMSHERIAEATGIPLGTVKTHIRRGLMRVRELLGADQTGPVGTVGPEVRRGVAP